MKKKEIIAELKKDIEGLAAINKILTQERNGLLVLTEMDNAAIKSMVEENNSLTSTNKSMKSRLSNQEETIKTLQSELAMKKAENEKLKSEKYCAKMGYINYSDLVTINDLKKENEKLKSQITSAADYWKGEIKRYKLILENRPVVKGTDELRRLDEENARLRELICKYTIHDFDKSPLKSEGLLQSEKDKEIDELKAEIQRLKEIIGSNNPIPYFMDAAGNKWLFDGINWKIFKTEK